MADQQAFAEAYRQLNPNATAAQIQSTFNVFNPPATGVPAASLSPGVPMSLPQTNPQQESSKLNALATSFGAEALAAEGEQKQAQGSYDSASNDLINLSKQLENQTADQFNLENQSGIPEISKDLLELQNQARQRNLQYQKQFITAEGQPIPMGVIVGQQAQLQRQEAVDIALINSNIQAKQGQLALAQSTVDRALAAKYEPLKARLETQKLVLQQGYDKLTRAEQKLRDAKIEEKNLKLKEIENEEENRAGVLNLINTAAANGASSAQLKFLMENAESPEAFFELGGGNLLQDIDTQIIELSNGSKVLVNTRTGATIKNFGGGIVPTGIPGITVNGGGIDATVDPTVQSWVNQIQAGMATISNVPAAYKNAVIQAIDNAPKNDTRGSELKQQALEAIGTLESTPGKKNAIGFGVVKNLAGSKSAGYLAQLDRVKSLLTLPNLQYLKGLGAMSDREFATIQSSVAALSPKMSEKQFDAELARIKGVLSGSSPSNKNSGTTSSGVKYTIETQ